MDVEGGEPGEGQARVGHTAIGADVEAGETVPVHHASVGVGLLTRQRLKAHGAAIIGTVGSGEKAEVARSHGRNRVIIPAREVVAGRGREITGGAGVPVVDDSINKDRSSASLDCLRPLGMVMTSGTRPGRRHRAKSAYRRAHQASHTDLIFCI